MTATEESTVDAPPPAGERTPLGSRLRERLPALPVLLWMAGAVALGGSPGPAVPRAGLDGSWITAINVGAARDMRFGREILFTFGPWGFLERPLVIDNAQLALGLLFAAAAAAALFATAYAALSRLLSPVVAAPLAFAATLATPVADPGLRFFCAALILALITRWPRDGSAAPLWPTAVLAVGAGFMIQVKFSEGVAIAVIATVVAVAVPTLGGLARGAAVLLLGSAVTFLVAWLLAGQSPADIPAWLRGSVELSRGYEKAMALERADGVTGYLLAVALTAVVAALAVRMARRSRDVTDGGRGGAAAVGGVLIVAAALEFAFKHGFTRHDAGHEPTFFVIAGAALLALAGHARRPLAALVAAAVAFVVVPPGLGQFDPFAARDRWRTSAEAVLNDGYRANLLLDAKRQARAEYRLPQRLAEEAAGHPVSVDPWQAALPWAYSMRWRPAPVFQGYSAYTAWLDELNAESVTAAPADQVVLRAAGEGIDGRNARWETPRYLLALACTYAAGPTEGGWSLLRHGADRCGEPRPVGGRDVRAGEAVDVPAPGPDEIVVARFTPEPDGPLTVIGDTLLKDWSPLTATADGQRYRLPEGLAGGPLMVAFPATLGWGEPFRYRSLSFNRSGSVRFESITVGP